MKRCKICGSVVHIESNTCPKCGGHSFDVLDVKVCPLCGKVNDINSSFCEYCGKDFGYAGGYAGDPGYGYGGAGAAGEPESARPSDDAERAALKYLTLRPEITSDGREKKYAYYVSDEKVPIVILPTFDTDAEKSVKVEILMVPERRGEVPAAGEPAEGAAQAPAPAPDGTSVQFPAEKKPLFVEKKSSAGVQGGITVFLTLLALASLAGFFLTMMGGTSGLNLLLGMCGWNEEGAAVVELIKAGGMLGTASYISFCAMSGLLVLCVVLQVAFLRHKRYKKALLILLELIAIVAFGVVLAGNFLVLKASFATIGLGNYLIGGGLILQLLFTALLYNR